MSRKQVSKVKHTHSKDPQFDTKKGLAEAKPQKEEIKAYHKILNEQAKEKFPADISAQYFLTEFEMLHNRALLQEQTIANKINFYLAITTAIGGGIFLVSDNKVLNPFLLPLSCIVLIFLVLVGWSTFLQTLDLSAGSTFYYRRAGRIRKWFLDNEPALEPYIPFVVTDESPRFYITYAGLRGVESIFLLVNSAVAATLSGLLFWLSYPLFLGGRLLIPNQALYAIGIAIGISVFALYWTIQVFYTRRFMLSREKREYQSGKVHFPHP